MSISKPCKSQIETRPTLSAIRRMQRRPTKAATVRTHPLKVKSAKLPRRTFLRLATGAVALPAVPRFARGQAYPSRPITMIVPYPGGAPMDVIGRILAERMRTSLGQPVIIENVSGADGSIGTGRAARARPDGYTIALGAKGTHVMNGAFYSLQYDPFNDFTAVAPLVTFPFILFARKTLVAKDLRDLIVWLKANPNEASIAITNNGTRLLAMFFQKETGTQITLVPYRGLPAAAQDLAAGQVDLLLGTPDQLSLMRAGSIKAYAVTGEMPLTLAPDLPSFAEMGLPTLSYSEWIGLFTPKGTQREIVSKLQSAAVDTLADPATGSRFADLGFGIFPRDQQTSAALTVIQKADAEKWWPIIKEFGIKAE